MLRLCDNPVQRFPLERPLEEDLGLWGVAHVKSRQDKSLANDLERLGISYYMPMAEKRTRRRDNGKIRKSIMPLFPGYLAFASQPEQWEDLYKTNRVATLIPVDDQDLFVSELAQVQRALEGQARVELAPAFQPGQPVRVKSGPMLGMEGEVVAHRGETMFVIRVNMFQQAIRVELDELYLEAR